MAKDGGIPGAVMTDFIGFGVASKSSMISRIGLRVDADVEATTDHFVHVDDASSSSSSSSSSWFFWRRLLLFFLAVGAATGRHTLFVDQSRQAKVVVKVVLCVDVMKKKLVV